VEVADVFDVDEVAPGGLSEGVQAIATSDTTRTTARRRPVIPVVSLIVCRLYAPRS